MRIDYRTFSDAHNALALLALRRTAGAPVILDVDEVASLSACRE